MRFVLLLFVFRRGDVRDALVLEVAEGELLPVVGFRDGNVPLVFEIVDAVFNHVSDRGPETGRVLHLPCERILRDGPRAHVGRRDRGRASWLVGYKRHLADDVPGAQHRNLLRIAVATVPLDGD